VDFVSLLIPPVQLLNFRSCRSEQLRINRPTATAAV